jgi:hypothetical protein
MGAAEISQFLTSLGVERHVSASTQNQALSALLSLYKVVLGTQPLCAQQLSGTRHFVADRCSGELTADPSEQVRIDVASQLVVQLTSLGPVNLAPCTIFDADN